MKTNELQDRLAKELESIGLAGKWWGRGETAERFYFGASAEVKKDGKAIRNKVWLQFDDAATLEGVSLRVEPKKEWYRSHLATKHAPATIVAIRMIDPEEADRLQAQLDAASRIGDLVQGEDE